MHRETGLETNEYGSTKSLYHWEELCGDFKAGRLRALVVSKVADFAVDLPNANVMIEISGMFGSRQEEARRLGRILHPKDRPSHFYTLVSRGTDDRVSRDPVTPGEGE